MELKYRIDDTHYWIALKTDSSEEIARSFKHRVVVIYRFPNRNGRHSRIMTDLSIEIFSEKIF
ncbi:hypothetical protein [Maribacter sp. ACAM166]|uniref:hypothetical protein n=1 Tax=Maribacter sp. ACAM166 TaxID=2508996 RepID=UPI0010FEAB79|nr:hypothetical protein [Maribacter sp. ACAM166]TLP82200.1 hypothetical protein ES765_01830 [Maribacter sp. ACAM166]